MRITQKYNLLLKELIVAAELQFDLNQLFTVINSIDKDNLVRPGSVFDWGNTKLNNVNDPLGEIGDSTDLQVAVTKNWLKAKLFAAGKFFDPANGNWHLHTNKATIDLITSAGDGAIPSAAERARFLTQNEKDALTAASSPTGSNPVATIADISAVNPTCFHYSESAYNLALAPGMDTPSIYFDFATYTLVTGRIEAAMAGGAFGTVDISMGWDGTNVWVMLSNWNWSGPGSADWPIPSIVPDALLEDLRTITFNPGGLGNQTLSRVLGLAVGAVHNFGFAAGSGLMQITRMNPGVKTAQIWLRNNTGITQAAKITIIGWRK